MFLLMMNYEENRIVMITILKVANSFTILWLALKRTVVLGGYEKNLCFR